MKRRMILFILLLSLAGCGTDTIPEKESEEQSVEEAVLEVETATAEGETVADREAKAAGENPVIDSTEEAAAAEETSEETAEPGEGEIPWKNPAPAEPIIIEYEDESHKLVSYGDIVFDMYSYHVSSKEIDTDSIVYSITADKDSDTIHDGIYTVKISKYCDETFPTRDQAIKILMEQVEGRVEQVDCFEHMPYESDWEKSKIQTLYTVTNSDTDLVIALAEGTQGSYVIESTYWDCPLTLYNYNYKTYEYQEFYAESTKNEKYTVKRGLDYEKEQAEFEVYYNGNLAHVIHMEYIENSELSDDPIYGQERWKGTVKDKNGKLLQEFDDWPALTPIANDCPYMSDVNEDGYLDFVMSEKYGYAFCTWHPKEQRYEVVETEALIWQFGIEDGYIRNWGKPDQYGVDYWELHWQGDKLVKKNAHFVER